MATLPTNVADAFRNSIGTAQRQIRASVISTRARAADNHWQRWETFCHQHSLDPFLLGLQDPFPTLQVFAARYQSGENAPGVQAVRSCTVEDALRAVGQGFISAGPKTLAKHLVALVESRGRPPNQSKADSHSAHTHHTLHRIPCHNRVQ
jgi:hypothetical protein